MNGHDPKAVPQAVERDPRPIERERAYSRRARWRLAPLALCLTALATAPDASAETLRLTARDVTAITDAARALFEGARDGQPARIAEVIPTRQEFLSLFLPNTLPFIERHQRALERDARELRATFAGGVFVRLEPGFSAGRALRLERCGRFGASSSQCADGPIFEYRVGTAVRRFRLDRIVRLRGGAWKIFDARM
jgi:hypothetical protein